MCEGDAKGKGKVEKQTGEAGKQGGVGEAERCVSEE